MYDKLAAFVSIAIMCWVISCDMLSAQITIQNNNWDARPQDIHNRVIIDTLFLNNQILNLEENDFFDIHYFALDNKGNIAAFDYGHHRLIYFPANNPDDYKFYSEGKGRGPGEYILIRDIEFDVDGNIWILDMEQAKLDVWSRKGFLKQSFISSLKYVRPYKLALCNSGFALISEQYLKDGFYHMYSNSGQFQFTFKTIENGDRNIDQIYRDASYIRGDMICVDDKILHAGRYKNYLRYYDQDGKLVKSVKTIWNEDNKEPLIKVNSKYGGRHDEVKTITGNVSESNGLILASYSGKKYWFYILDVYDKDLNYLYSYKFKKPVKEFAANDSMLIVKEYDRQKEQFILSEYKLPERITGESELVKREQP